MASRKTQTEIDKLLKSIQQTVSEFDEMKQTYNAAQSQQELEKSFIELDKIIKRLAKIQPQIKGYKTYNYNVRSLEEAKRNIEDCMTQFKEVEQTQNEKREEIEDAEENDDTEDEEGVLDLMIVKLKQQIEDFQKEKDVKNKKKQSQNRKNQISRSINQLNKHLDYIKTIKMANDYNLLDDDDLRELENQLDSITNVKDLTRENTFEMYQHFDINGLKSQIEDEEEEIRNAKEREKEEEMRQKQSHITTISAINQVEKQSSPTVLTPITPLNQQPTQQNQNQNNQTNRNNQNSNQITTIHELKPTQNKQANQNNSNVNNNINNNNNQQQIVKKQLDDKTISLLKDIDYSYTSMMNHHNEKKFNAENQKGGPLNQNNQYPKWFPKEAIEFDFKSPNIDDEFLFFLFYYQQGTSLQLKAAEMLKQRKWKYHKGYQKWFKEHNEPIYSSDVSENGDYMCFEYESWYNVSKSHFTFFSNFMEH